MLEKVNMRHKLILFFVSVSFAVFAQAKTKSKPEPIFGLYEYKRQEGKDAYAIVKITLNKDQTYSYHSSSHTLKTSADDNGKWTRTKDTLFLINKEASIEKYRISEKTICDLSEPEGQTCLQKIK
jgi:hypothetical protein